MGELFLCHSDRSVWYALLCEVARRIKVPCRTLTKTMKTKRAVHTSMDEYIAGFPQDVQAILEKVRTTIRKAAPGAEEKISYEIPAFNLNGRYLIYFAAFKKHIGVYPAPIGNAEFKDELSAYASGKASARFPLDKPVPVRLITKIVKFRIKENLKRAAAKK